MSATMTRHRPIGVTILAILAGIAGFVSVVHTLQYLHLMPFFLGPLAFFGFDLLSAFLWAVSALIWTWVCANLWHMNPQAWIFVVVFSILNLILDGLGILGASTFQALLPSILINAIALIYSLTPGVRQAFGVPNR
jgi:hypothetical protein